MSLNTKTPSPGDETPKAGGETRRRRIAREIRIVVASIIVVTAINLGIDPFSIWILPIFLVVALLVIPEPIISLLRLIAIPIFNLFAIGFLNRGKHSKAERVKRIALDLAGRELGVRGLLMAVRIRRRNGAWRKSIAREMRAVLAGTLNSVERKSRAREIRIVVACMVMIVLLISPINAFILWPIILLITLLIIPDIIRGISSWVNLIAIFVLHLKTFRFLHRDQYLQAEKTAHSALNLSERELGENHPITLTNIGNLAAVYIHQGRYGEAEPLHQRAFEICEGVLGVKNPKTLAALNNLAGLYDAQGRYGESESLHQRALEICKQVFGTEHPNTLLSLGNLAGLYYVQGHYEKAEPLFQRALEICEHTLGAEHPDTLSYLNNLAALYQKQGRHEEAEHLLQRALSICNHVLKKDDVYTLTSLHNTASLHNAQGRYSEAESLYERVLGISEHVLGKGHPRALLAQFNLAITHVNNRQIPLALRGSREIDVHLQAFIEIQLDSTLSEKVRRQWLRFKSNFQDAAFTLALAKFVPEENRQDTKALAADVLLRWQRLAGESEALIAHLARVSRDPKVRKLAQSLAKARAEWSRQVNLPELNPKGMAAARARVEETEVKLAGLSREFKDQQASRTLEWRQVAAVLPPGSALLSLRTFESLDFKTEKFSESRWLALLIPAMAEDGSEIVLNDLGPATAVVEQFARLRMPETKSGKEEERFVDFGTETSTRAREKKFNEEARKLYALLFGELDAELVKYDSLYLAPDGLLDLVPFARLVLPDGRYWTERQRLHQIRAGRDLLSITAGGSLRSTPATPIDLVAFGNIDYNRSPTVAGGSHAAEGLAAECFRSSPPAVPFWDYAITTINQRLREERTGFKPLSFTGPEVEGIAKLYREFTNYPATVCTGPDASDYRLKHLSEPPRVLHLATHGFFLEKRSDRTDRPMTLGGLALAGANQGLKGEIGSDGEDGILYALEAQNLNLEGTELVVLSACDTGKGEVDVSEGVYGLTRAFRTAGAKNILMTLWPLHDELAAEFMKDFYRNWLSESGRSSADALHETRLAWIESKDERKRSPRYWAPYVLVE